MSEPAPVRWGGAPVALALGLGASVGLGALFHATLLWLARERDPMWTWAPDAIGLAWRALSPAASVLVIAGLLDLRRRVGPREGRALGVAIAGAAVLLVLPFAAYAAELWRKPLDERLAGQLEAARGWIVAGAALVVSGGLVAAGWDRPRVRVLAGPLVGLTALAFAAPPVRAAIAFGDGWVRLLIDRGLHASFAALAVACAAAVAAGRDAPVRWHRTAVGLRRVGAGLTARIVIAVATASIMIAAMTSHAASVLSAALWAVPLATAIASGAMITGLIRAAGLVAPGAPRARLYLAAGLTTWVAAVQVFQAAALLQIVYLERASEVQVAVIGALPYAQPLALMAALLALVSALGALGPLAGRAVADLGGAAILTTLSGVALTLVNRALYEGGGLSSVGSGVFWMLVLAGAHLAGQLVVVRACRRTAEALEALPELPVATVTAR